ncbi:hypothetical protein CAEBREN_11153 [Caenorhabditis brenneri]|uniref:histone acetyltransferase n=1 Tax=Caenorhabditis brenneri TaxID=135651 RepID=G0MWI9_CAEBE|nr:hypothetical protein CAEBREN_11153 [Caenorhabditis brenneri]
MVRATRSSTIGGTGSGGSPINGQAGVGHASNLFSEVENVVKLHSRKKWRKEGRELLGKIQTLRKTLADTSTTKLVNKCTEVIEIVKKRWAEVLRENPQERSSGARQVRTRSAASFIRNVEAAIWHKFDEEAKRRGLCCGRKQETFTEKRCSHEGTNNVNCLIRDGVYHEKEDSLLVYCPTHFRQNVGPRNTQGWREVFVRDEKQPKLETCSKCAVQYHPTCTHFKPQSREPLPKMCSKCAGWENHVDLNLLDDTSLSKYMTRYVRHASGKIPITIKELYVGRKKTGDWTEEEKEKNRDLYEDIKGISYRYRIIGAFQHVAEKLILMALFSVQEYGVSNPSKPKNGQVCLEYFDTNHQYQQKKAGNDQERTNVYSYILLAYFQYAASLGYSEVHIWACPPFEGQNYMFLGRSEIQLPTTVEQLHAWYMNMSKKSKLLVEMDTHKEDDLKNVIGDKSDIRSIRQRLYYEGGRFMNELAQKSIGADEQKFKKKVGDILQRQSYELCFFKIKRPAKPQMKKESKIPSTLFSCRQSFALWQKREQYDWTTPQKANYFTKKLIWDIFTNMKEMAEKEIQRKGDKAHGSAHLRVSLYQSFMLLYSLIRLPPAHIFPL